LRYTILPHPLGCPTHHGHAVVATEAPPTYPHHHPVIPARPPPPSVDCRVIRPARRSRCAACCPAALCRHHPTRRSRCAFCRPAAPCCCRAARRRRVPPVTIVVRPIEVDCRVIGRCPPLFVAVVARSPPPAALLSCRRCLSLNRRAAAAIS
jgi:hypothetical protein